MGQNHQNQRHITVNEGQFRALIQSINDLSANLGKWLSIIAAAQGTEDPAVQAAIQEQTAKLKASTDSLQEAVDANQPHTEQ